MRHDQVNCSKYCTERGCPCACHLEDLATIAEAERSEVVSAPQPKQPEQELIEAWSVDGGARPDPESPAGLAAKEIAEDIEQYARLCNLKLPPLSRLKLEVIIREKMLIQRVEDYRSGYSCGYSDAKNGTRMRDKDAASAFFNIDGVPDVFVEDGATDGGAREMEQAFAKIYRLLYDGTLIGDGSLTLKGSENRELKAAIEALRLAVDRRKR